MNLSRLLSTRGRFMGCLWLALIADPAHAGLASATQPTGEPIARLAPGKQAGTFHLVYHSTARFSMEGRCPLAVSISDSLHEEFAPTSFDGPGAFTLEADLRPGTYNLTVSPAVAENADYWPSDWQSIHIDKAGRLYPTRGWLSAPGDFVLDRRMKGIAPDQLAVADAPQPMLKWPAVAGATHYRGDYRGGDKMKWFDVEETQYVIGGGLEAGDWCMWRVVALGADGMTLARGEASFFGQGTDAATLAKMRAAGGTCGVGTAAGTPYLGFRPMPTQVPKDPRAPVVRDPTHGYTIQDEASGFIPGIEVNEVLPGSPAIDAGLIPDDVIIAVDGQRVPAEFNQGDERAFVRQISTMAPGRQVALTVRRFPRELTLRATIGRYGIATTQPTQPAPATAPAAPQELAVAQAAAASPTWSNVDAGSPAEVPFQAKPGVDIPALSTKEGLAADYVTHVTELPDGQMAFGTHDGLSIWDGSKIRTYTGPSFSGVVEGTVEGNSGLPGNRIQDLFCDSRGRLWVATQFGVCRIETAAGGHWRALANPDRDAFARHGKDATLDVEKIFEASDGTIVLGARCSAITLWWTIGIGAARRSRLTLISANPRDQLVEKFKRDIEMAYPKIKPDEKTAVGPGGVVVGVADERLLRFDGKTWEDLSARFGRLHVYQIRADSRGTIWVATGGRGLIGLDPGGGFRRYNDDPGHSRCVIYAIAETLDGTLYAGTQDGVYRLRGQAWEHVESDLFQVGQLLVDRHGRVWMMEITYSKLYVYDGRRFREVKDQTFLSDEKLQRGSLRLDAQGRVLVDVPARPAAKVPRRTFRWDATAEEVTGPPVEVK